MRILMIIDGLPGGGAEKVVLTLCQGMRILGHEISLLSLRNICHYPIPIGVRYQVVETLNHSFSWLRLLTKSQQKAYQLRQIIQKKEENEGQFDLIFSHLHQTDRIVSSANLLSDKKIWYCVHSMLSTSYLNHRYGFSRWIKKRKIMKVYRGKNILAVSKAIKEDLIYNFSILPNQLAIINNPFNISYILNQSNKDCNLPPKPYLIHVGRFHPTKRHDRLLEAYAQSNIPALLVLVGTGNTKQVKKITELIEKLNISKKVILTGFQDNPYPLIKNAVMLILSSDSEGFGNVLVEALLCGTPVISTCCPGGPKEILTEAGEDRALTELNTNSLAKKMIETYLSPPSRLNIQKLIKYDLLPICKQYLNLVKINYKL
ncbi:glycosyltransferase [Candidatus Erwinia haradaeae]|uniref:Glycosyl transferase group 1 family protein n=1 Tax=Candidatus Erwinia haradaeae TaxID=1922217 RepID=A0A451D7L2_9GAMM|nr:glycosyltransferase [Candidatus Erwinia haradaeae]VFP81841.1 Glycosyl transferase group 1 family protein [Candidatus Erwinia haradaeae]